MLAYNQISEGWMSAPLPENEDRRLDALRNFNVLDTEPEEAFDQITKLLSRLLGTKFALVSLVDKDRQWFKSTCGIDAKETPRDQAFCAHALFLTQPLVVLDATQDERFMGNPLVTGEPHIRFYAGMPLITAEGYALGTLCAIDVEPREVFSAEDSYILESLASLVMQVMDIKKGQE